jgi:SAM-dependent methyltransferase
VPEIVNVEQAAAWNGSDGEAWVEREERLNEALRPHTEGLFAAAGVGRDDRILDIGCGCGETTRECGRRAVDGEALGVDLSSGMLERARVHAAEEGLTNVRFDQGDAQVHPFPSGAFDLVVSRFGCMFFADPAAAFANIASAGARGGRLALVVWQELRRNEWLAATRDALAIGRDVPEPAPGTPGPFGLADPDRARAILEAAGFARVDIRGAEVPFRFGAGPEDAFTFALGIGVVRGLLDGLDPGETTRALDALRATIDEHDTGDGVVFDSRTWTVTAFR